MIEAAESAYIRLAHKGLQFPALCAELFNSNDEWVIASHPHVYRVC